MPHDHAFDDECALLHAELRSVYAQLEHVSAIASVLQAALHGLLDALEVPPCRPWTFVQGRRTGQAVRQGQAAQLRRDHWLLALREAREAMRQAE